MIAIAKQPILIEDLGKHAPEGIAELGMLLEAGEVGHPDSHRPHFYELDRSEHVYYIFRYPAGQKVGCLAKSPGGDVNSSVRRYLLLHLRLRMGLFLRPRARTFSGSVMRLGRFNAKSQRKKAQLLATRYCTHENRHQRRRPSEQ